MNLMPTEETSPSDPKYRVKGEQLGLGKAGCCEDKRVCALPGAKRLAGSKLTIYWTLLRKVAIINGQDQGSDK